MRTLLLLPAPPSPLQAPAAAMMPPSPEDTMAAAGIRLDLEVSPFCRSSYTCWRGRGAVDGRARDGIETAAPKLFRAHERKFPESISCSTGRGSRGAAYHDKRYNVNNRMMLPRGRADETGRRSAPANAPDCRGAARSISSRAAEQQLRAHTTEMRPTTTVPVTLTHSRQGYQSSSPSSPHDDVAGGAAAAFWWWPWWPAAGPPPPRPPPPPLPRPAPPPPLYRALQEEDRVALPITTRGTTSIIA